MRYSPEQKIFFPEEINYPNLPGDVITVSETDFHSAINRPARASFTFDSTGTLSITPPPPQPSSVIQNNKTREIQNFRDNLWITGGYQVNGKWFDSDPFSRTQQLGLVAMGSNMPSGLQWKTMDGSFIEMTPALALEILSAGAASDNAIFQAGETILAEMLASPNPATFDINQGWPKVYGQ
jgi:hypothetical protein